MSLDAASASTGRRSLPRTGVSMEDLSTSARSASLRQLACAVTGRINANSMAKAKIARSCRCQKAILGPKTVLTRLRAARMAALTSAAPDRKGGTCHAVTRQCPRAFRCAASTGWEWMWARSSERQGPTRPPGRRARRNIGDLMSGRFRTAGHFTSSRRKEKHERDERQRI